MFPRPRKLNPDSVVIAPETESAMRVSRISLRLGKMWRTMMTGAETPIAFSILI